MKRIDAPEPPIVQAEDHWDEATRTLTYTYGDWPLMAILIPGKEEPSYRRDSDGTLNSIPLVQQIYVMLKESVTAQVTFRLGAEAVNMRPRRARAEEAILGQVGRPLLKGVNGLYDVQRDFLLSWHGRPWRWREQSLSADENGNLSARLEVELGPSAWFLNFKPQFYRTHYGYKYHTPWKRRPELKPISGWCSWEACRRNVSQDVIARTAEFCARHFKPYGMEYIQLDDGYEKLPVPSDPAQPLSQAWLETDPQKFAGGHEGIVQSIAATGMTPGVWTSVSIYNDEFPKHQSDCIVKDADGQPILGAWIKYLLDCRPATLARHVAPAYGGLAKFGYRYFKTDVTRHLLFDGFHKAVAQGVMTNEQSEAKHRAYLESAREAIGDDAFWLLSWGVMTEGAGAVDACRVSMDALPTWSGLRMQLIEPARWWHTQRILWQNDPDHVCMRGKREWVRSVISLTSLSGGLLMLSDAIDEYDAERVYMIQRCLPPLPAMTAETGPLDTDYTAFTWTKFHGFGVLHDPPYAPEDMSEEDARNMAGWSETMNDAHPFGALWCFHLENETGRWAVLYRVGIMPLRPGAIEFDKLGLDDGEYLAFDFWKQEFVGYAKGRLACPALGIGESQVIALRKLADRPQFLSSSRHVSQDAVSVVSQAWRDRTLTFELRGAPGMAETYWFHVPAGWTLKAPVGRDLSAGTQTCVPTEKGSVVGVKVVFGGTTGAVALAFE